VNGLVGKALVRLSIPGPDARYPHAAPQHRAHPDPRPITLAGVVSPKDDKGETDMTRKVMIFVKCDGAEWPYVGAWIGDFAALKVFP
jgi:hypothetical protein